MQNSEYVKEYQHDLDSNVQARREFVEAENESEPENQQIRIYAPKQNKKNHIEEMMLQQFISQQQEYLLAQKKIYKLKTTINTEEVKTRYLKLDLNNVQVDLEKSSNKCKEYENQLYHNKIEVWTTRILLLIYVLYRIYSMF
jgi:hypothetical protein